MINSIYILGDHIQSLNIARIAGKLGYEVILINESGICISRFSKYCNKFFIFKSEKELIRIFKKLSNAKKNILLMPTNDKFIKFIINNYNFLSSRFLLSTPNPEILNLCYNKKKTYLAATKKNIPIPESYFPETFDDLLLISRKIKYPVLIKPSIMHKFYKKTGKKVFMCWDEKDLLKNYYKALNLISPSEIIIQQFIKGGSKNLYSYCSFFADGRVYGSFIANRIRQKPIHFGISTTFAKTVVNNRIEELGIEFLKSINYFGLSEVEFMYDSKIDNYRLIEINPRTWKWHNISNKIGINLIKMLIDYFDNKKIKVLNNNKENIIWIERITDAYVVAKEICKGTMKVKDYFNTFKLQKEYACWDSKDPVPAFAYLFFLVYLYLKR